MTRVLRPFIKLRASHLNGEFLQTYGVDLREFGLDSGVIPDPRSGRPEETFTQVMSRKVRPQAMRSYKPWASPNANTGSCLNWDEDLDD